MPNLFLIGAPKCGTSAMSHYLAGHPDIFMSEQAGLKEPYFHCPDLTAPWRVAGVAEYQDLFAKAPPESRFIGEASAAYLYSTCAVPNILAACPQAAFIVMLRNPVELVVSLHNQFWKNDMEVADFAEAWRLQAARARGEALPLGFLHGRLHQYGLFAALGGQMERLYRQVDRAQVHCIVYDDFSANPAQCYRDTLAFLGVPDDGRTEFAKINPSISHRSQRLQRGIGTLECLASRHAAAGALAGILRKANTRHGKATVAGALVATLRAYFRDDIDLLSEVMQRDFSPWLKGRPAARQKAPGRGFGMVAERAGVGRIRMPEVTLDRRQSTMSPAATSTSDVRSGELMPRKTIRRKADLAIHGAPPALLTPLHVGRPNVVDRDAFLVRMGEVLDNQWLTNNGPMVQELERRLAMQLGVRHCVTTCNGTTALEIAIRALGLTGEVILPSWTFIATAHALSWQGITPVFADIDPATHTIDPAAVRRLITPRTTGIVGVHLWGRAAPVEELQVIADEHGLKLLFDAAHAFGSTFRGQLIGGFGNCEAFSFHATKSFNTMEGGAITTNDDELANTLRLMRNFGFEGYDNVVCPGINGKMTEACAAMGLTNLDGFADVVAANRHGHAIYREVLGAIPGVAVLDYDPAERSNYHYVVAEVDAPCAASRDEIVAALQAENILARKYFWPGCHRMQPYRDSPARTGQSLAHTEAVANRVIVLPNGPSVSDDAIHVVGEVLAVLARG